MAYASGRTGTSGHVSRSGHGGRPWGQISSTVGEQNDPFGTASQAVGSATLNRADRRLGRVKRSGLVTGRYGATWQ
jgi:hypothetical protein